MVKTPDFSENVQLRQRGNRNYKARASASGVDGGVSQGLNRLAGGLNSVAEAFQFRDTIKAEADTREAMGRLRDAERQIMYDPENGYMLANGKRALDGTRGKAMENLERARSDIRNGLSPMAQKEFDRLSERRISNAKDTTIKHEGVELKSYTYEQIEASAQGYLDDAVMNSHSDEKFAGNLAQAEQEIRRASALAGDAPEVLEGKVSALYQTANANRVVEIAREDPVKAFDYLQQNRDKIDSAKFNKLHGALEPVHYAHRARDWVEGSGGIGGDAPDVPTGDVISYTYEPGEQQGPTRNKAVGRKLTNTMNTALRKLGMGFEVTSGGQDAKGEGERRTGSTRHDHGNAADGYFTKNGKRLSWDDPGHRAMMAEAIWELRQAGVTGAGWGPSYMGKDVFHIGFGDEAIWSSTKSGQPVEDWLQRAWNGELTDDDNPPSTVGVTMADAMKIEDPKMREAVLSEISTRRQAYASDRQERQRAASEQAWDVVDQGGAPDDITPDLAAEVGVRTMNEIYNAYERNVTGVDFTREETWNELTTMMSSPEANQQREFANLDLNDLRNELSQADFRTFRSAQLEMQSDFKTMDEQGMAAVVYPSPKREKDIGNFEEKYYTAYGVKKSDAPMEVRQRWSDFQTQMRGLLRQYAEDNGTPPPPQEQQAMFDGLMTPVLIEGVTRGPWYKRENPRAFEAARLRRNEAGIEAQLGIDDVPADEYDRISQKLSDFGVMSPSDDDIVEQYENELLFSVGVEPTIEFDEIPEDLRRQMVQEYPGYSPEQLRELYLELMIEAARPDAAGTQ